MGHGVQRSRSDGALPVGVEVDEGHGGCRLGVHVEPGCDPGGLLYVGRQVTGPCTASLGNVDPSHERRDDRPELMQHLRSEPLHFGEGMGSHPEQQGFVRLT